MQSNDEIFKTELFNVKSLATEATEIIVDEPAIDGHRDLIKAMQDTRNLRSTNLTAFTKVSTNDEILKDQDMDIINDLLWGTAGFKCSI